MQMRSKTTQSQALPEVTAWDNSTHEHFYQYYAEESQTEEKLQRFRQVRDNILKTISGGKPVDHILDVGDIGCGAGTQSMVWAELGHLVHGLDVNGPLLELAQKRAEKAGYQIDFQVGSATRLPWANASMDVCIMLELLEHVADWRACLNESTRVLRPGGVLFLTTTNQLCPIQEEFTLPLYGWYPKALKRRFEQLAVTTRPELANYCRYPAVNWFTFAGLSKEMTQNGFRCLDRFDMMDLRGKSRVARLLATAAREVGVLRFFGQVCTPGTRLMAIRRR